MKMFIKRFYGFGAHWPVVSFGKKGNLDSLLGQSEPGDLMAFLGTLGENTAPHERGKLLGFAQFGRRRLHSREALAPDTFAAAKKGANGDIQWPHAVAMTRAWRFTERPFPDVRDVLGTLPAAAKRNVVLLSAKEHQRVFALPKQEFNVAFTQAVWDERERIAATVGPGGTVGPIPASFTSQGVRDAFKEAWTYAYRLGMQNIWKVGWAHDPLKRLAELNQHIPSEVLGTPSWQVGWNQKWASAGQAYSMEQKVLA